MIKNAHCLHCEREIIDEFIHWVHAYREEVVNEWYCSMPCFLKERNLSHGEINPSPNM